MSHSPVKARKGAQKFSQFLDELEEGFESFENFADEALRNADSSARKTLEEFEKYWEKAGGHLQQLAKSLEEKEKKAIGAIQETQVQIHLAEMEAQDKLGDLSGRLMRIQRKTDSLLKEGRKETAKVLKRISDACSHLTSRLNQRLVQD